MRYQRRYKLTDHRFGLLALTLREKAGLTQTEVAAAVGVSERTIRHWEGGTAYPAPTNLQKLVALYLRYGAFEQGRERDEARALWTQADESAARRKALFDDAWFARQLAQHHAPSFPSSHTHASIASPNPPLGQRIDWGEAPDAATIYGREGDLTTLAQWVVTDRCRVVALLGMGGIGKTTLSVTLAQAVAPHFPFVLWRSLRNAPPLEELIADCMHTLAEQQYPTLPHNGERGITRLIDLLRQHRCLLVLDNVETLLEAGSLVGRYRAGYEGYGQFFQRVAETAHQSCLLLTSREMPSELDPLAGTDAAVRAFKLLGVERVASQALLTGKDLFGVPETWDAFTEHYAGNPLALKIAAATVRDLFGGDLAAFLSEGPATLHTLQQMLHDQFERLSPLERDVMSWLAIERDSVALEDLAGDVASAVPKKDLLAALKGLRRRSLVERGEQNNTFTLQPVVMEYVTERLVAQVCDDVLGERTALLTKYALMKAQSSDYIRESQVRMLVQPVLSKLLAHLGDQQRLVAHLQLLVRRLQAMPFAAQGYAGGNIVNLLVCLQGNLRGWDGSQLVLRQAYLQGVEAQAANFASADVSETRFTEPGETIAAMTLSPDGTYVAVGSFSGQVRVWQVVNGEPVWSVKGHSRMAWALAFNADGTVLASCGYGGRVRLWDAARGRCFRTLQAHSKWVRTAAFSPTAPILVSAGDDATVRVWDMQSGRCVRELDGHQGMVWSAAFSPDGALFVTGGSDGTLRVWTSHTGECVRIVHGHKDGVFTVAFHPHGQLVASGGQDDGLIKLWDVHTGACVATLHRHATGSVSVAFNPDGTLLASGSNNGVVELRDIANEHNRHYVGTLHGHQWLVSAVAFAPQNLLASATYGGHVRLWEAQRGKLLRTIHGYSRLITAIAFSPNGTLLAQGDDNGMIRIWDVHRGCCLIAVQGHVGPVWAITWNPDGTTFASGGDDPDVTLWDARTGRAIQRFGGHPVVVWALAFSPDGTLLASGGGDKVIKLWRVASEENEEAVVALPRSSDQIVSLAFDADGGTLASGEMNGAIKLWDVAGGYVLKNMQHHASPVGTLRFSTHGETLLSSSNRELLQWWDVASGECLETLPAEAGGYWFKAAALSADGALLATGSDDRTVKLWRADGTSDAQQPQVFRGHAGQIWAVALSPDHRILASSDDEGTIMVWDTQTGAIIRRLWSDRPYERMNIDGITGISTAQRAALLGLGAIDDMEQESAQ